MTTMLSFQFDMVGQTYMASWPEVHKTLVRRHPSPENPILLKLRRDPTNLHDENAIKIVCPWLIHNTAIAGVTRYQGMAVQIGWVPAEIAREIAPLLDKGRSYVARMVDASNEQNLSKRQFKIHITL